VSAALWGGLGLAVLAVAACSSCDATNKPQQPENSGESSGYRVTPTTATFTQLAGAKSGAWDAATEIAWGPAPYTTSFRALWSDEGLAIRFEAMDGTPWHTLSERDAPLWNEEVVEIFIDPDGDGRNYAEIEINPVNVVCDLQIFDTEPRLRSDIDWDFVGLRTHVVTTHDDGDEPSGWIATALLPWEGFAALENTVVPLPPSPGDRWSFNVFRIKRPGGPQSPERDAIYAPWSPTPSLSFHAPSAFRDLEFVP